MDSAIQLLNDWGMVFNIIDTALSLLFLLRIGSAHLGSGLIYSGFLRNLPANTKVFFFCLCGKSRSQQGLSEAKKKIGGGESPFFRGN